MLTAEGWPRTWICLSILLSYAHAARPRFDISTDMGMVLVPMDAQVDSVIFRLRATDQDADFPLIFEIIAKTSPIVRVENLPCTLYNKVCQANVILTRRLIPGRLHDFIVRVRDSAGDVNSMQATISVTNSTTPRDKIFPYVPSLIMVPENTKPEKELDYLLVESNPWSGKPVYIELWQPKELFKIRQRQMGSQTKGIITLTGDLDFETQSMYTLTMYATDPYTEPGKDTRNIAGLHIVVIVQDVQDVPPVFTLAPPLTKINNTIKPGDLILRVHAEDGDKGVPRDVTYGLISEGNPFTPFFNVSETTGEIFLARPLEELTKITHVGAPIILKIVAEEVRTMRDEPPAQATIVELGILLGEPGNSPPYFENDNYVAWMDENAESGTTVVFSEAYSTLVRDEDIGKAGVFALLLENNNGTFEISPNVAERTASFIITVRDNTFIDYEKFKSLRFRIVAQEVGPATNLSTSVPVTIFLRDVNDNPPIFDEPVYEVTLAENTIAGTRVTQVHATDSDIGYFGRIHYVRIIGEGGEAFDLNEDDGLITVLMSSILDREVTSKLELIVEARDEEGRGLRGNTTLIVNILDINDNAPIFEKEAYEFLLNLELTNFTMPAFIKAVDADAEPPNNIIRYEIVHGNYDNKFKLNEETGQVTLVESIDDKTRNRRNANLVRRIRSLGKFSPKNQSDEIEITDSTHGLNFQGPRVLGDYTQPQPDPSDLSRKRRAETDPLFILTARAYDLGVPHLSSTTQIRIMRSTPALARTVMFVMPGENPDPTKTAETLATITGSRVTIQEIKPYLQYESDNTAESTRKSVVIAQVEQKGSGTLVDVEKIRESLAASGFGVISGMDNLAGESSGIPSIGGNPRPSDLGRSTSKNITAIGFDSEDVAIYKAENRLLIWLLILLALLVLAAVITLISCCICPSCPFYMEPRKRRIHSSETLIFRSDDRPKKHLYRKPAKLIDGHFSHYYSERKEAWSADPVHQQWQFNRRNKEQGISSLPGDVTNVQLRNDQLRMDRERQAASLRAGERSMYMEDVEAQNRNFNDLDSLKRHELERGSDAAVRNGDAVIADGPRHDRRESVREQHFYRDGNAEVLMLVTRGEMEDHNEPANHANLYHANGKDILLQRFIEDQKHRRDHDIRDSFQDSHRDEDMNLSMESHQRVQDTREILILPEKLEMQRHPIYLQRQRPENTIPTDTRIPIPDHLHKPVESRNDSSDIYMQENPKMLPKNLHEMAVELSESVRIRPESEVNEPGGMHHVELVRQNALLTKLLMKRERETVNMPGVDPSNLLETQSLPGLVAIATQTDNTTATQTEFIMRSRSDNEDLEDEHGLRGKGKYRGKFETKSDIRKMKTIWVSTPIPEENQNRNQPGQKSTPTRTRIEVMERKKISISPDYLKDTSPSPKSDDSYDNIAQHQSIMRQFVAKSDKARDGTDHVLSNKIDENIRTKATKANDDSTTSSPDTKGKNSKPGFRKRIEKPPRTRKPEKSTIQDTLNYMEPSFRVLEREISNFQRRIRKLGGDKLNSADEKELSESRKGSGSVSNEANSPSKSQPVKPKRKTDTTRTVPTKIIVHQRMNGGGKKLNQENIGSGQQKEVGDSDSEVEESLEIRQSSHDQNDHIFVSKSQTRNRAELKKQSALETSDTKSSDEKVGKTDRSEGRKRRSRIDLPPLPKKTSSNQDSPKESDEHDEKVKRNPVVKSENSNGRHDKVSTFADSSPQKKPFLKSKSLGGALKRTLKRKPKSLPLTSDESKLTSPSKNKNGQRFFSQRSSLNNGTVPVDFEKLVKDVKGAVEREISSLTQAARDAFTFQKSGYSVIGTNAGQTEYLLTSKMEAEAKQPNNYTEKNLNDGISDEKMQPNPIEIQENEKKSIRRKSKTGSRGGNSSEQSDEAISFIVIEKNETALGASDHGKIFQEVSESSKSRKNESGSSSRKNSNGSRLNTFVPKTDNVIDESKNIKLKDPTDSEKTAEAVITETNNVEGINILSSSTDPLVEAASDNLYNQNEITHDHVQNKLKMVRDTLVFGETEHGDLDTKPEDEVDTTFLDGVPDIRSNLLERMDGVESMSPPKLIEENIPSVNPVRAVNSLRHTDAQKENSNIDLVDKVPHEEPYPSPQDPSEEVVDGIKRNIELEMNQSQCAEILNDNNSNQHSDRHFRLPDGTIKIDSVVDLANTKIGEDIRDLEDTTLDDAQSLESMVTNDQMLRTETGAGNGNDTPQNTNIPSHGSTDQNSATSEPHIIERVEVSTDKPQQSLAVDNILQMEKNSGGTTCTISEHTITIHEAKNHDSLSAKLNNIESSKQPIVDTRSDGDEEKPPTNDPSPTDMGSPQQSCFMEPSGEPSPKTDNASLTSATQDTDENPFPVQNGEEENPLQILLRSCDAVNISENQIMETANRYKRESESSSGSSSISNKTALHVPTETVVHQQHSSSMRSNGVSSIPRLKIASGVTKAEGKTRQKWNTHLDRDSIPTIENQRQGETNRAHLQNRNRLPPMSKSTSTTDRIRPESMKGEELQSTDNQTNSARFVTSSDSKISKVTTSKISHQGYPSNHRPVVVAVRRKETQKTNPTHTSTHESHETSDRPTDFEDHSTSEQHKVEIRSKHLKLHVSHHYRRSRDEVSENEIYRRNHNEDENQSKPNTTDQQNKGPEVANARSRYMAWYQQKRAEMEKKRREKKEAEELLFRPKGCRGSLNGSKMRKAKSAPDDSGQVNFGSQSPVRRERTKSSSAEEAHARINRLHVKPLVNVESEQLKAIVRQGRKLRRAEGVREEDPPVQIFAPAEGPPLAIMAQSETRHHLTQHSEYKFEKAITAALPFYLHPPPVPHPSPEHCQDDSSDSRRIDDDLDSGIAVSLQGGNRLRHQQLLEKKTVFDIAYIEASPSQLRSDSSTPPS